MMLFWGGTFLTFFFAFLTFFFTCFPPFFFGFSLYVRMMRVSCPSVSTAVVPRAQHSTAQHSTAQRNHPCTKQQTKYVPIRVQIRNKYNPRHPVYSKTSITRDIPYIVRLGCLGFDLSLQQVSLVFRSVEDTPGIDGAWHGKPSRSDRETSYKLISHRAS